VFVRRAEARRFYQQISSAATWVNTAFDAQAGHAAYGYVIEGKLATRIDVQLTPVEERPFAS
jgi:hypothetical protein